MATDYDAPRTPAVDLGEISLEELQSTARRPRTLVDIDATELDLNGELPPDSLVIDDELTALVVPIKSDELRCDRCFLVRHQSQFVRHGNGDNICQECA
jgi:hypothetical protein